MSSLEARKKWESRTTVFLLFLGAAFIVAYSWMVLATDKPAVVEMALFAVLAIAWVAFAVDYLVRVLLTPRGQRMLFVRSNLPDLLSVFLPVFRAFSAIARLQDTPFFAKDDPAAVRVQVVTSAALYALVFIYMVSLATFDVERNAPNSSINTFGDAIWWALVTMTTVGYGDVYPVTALGRTYAIVVMFGGIAILGTASALVISVINERIGIGGSTPAAPTDEQA
jgi:voltage-gated potassium channel